MDAAERLLQFIDFKGYGDKRKGKSLRHFYTQVQLSIGTFKPGRIVSSDALKKVCDVFPDLNADWIINERGEMLFSEKSNILVGPSEERTTTAVQVLKDQVSELQAKLIKCLESKETLMTSYQPSKNEPGGFPTWMKMSEDPNAGNFDVDE